MKKKKGRYRPGVCVALTNRSRDRFLVFHRLGMEPSRGWQFVQGGVDTKKSIYKEARRELVEEIGTDAVTFVDETKEWFCYHFPIGVYKGKNKYIGQCHRWLLGEFVGNEKDIVFDNHTPEFDDYRWMSIEEVLKRLVPFKIEAYRGALTALGILPAVPSA